MALGLITMSTRKIERVDVVRRVLERRLTKVKARRAARHLRPAVA